MFWERDAARQFWSECVFYLGDLPALRETVLSGLREASDRAAIYTATNLRSGLANAVWLIDDEPEQAKHELSVAMKSWSVRGFHVQHWYALIAEAHVALYEGRGEQALRTIEARWPELSQSHLLRVNHTRIVAIHLAARAGLMAAHGASGKQRAAYLTEVRRQQNKLRRNEGGWVEALAALIDVGLGQLEGKPATEQEQTALIARLEAVHLNVYALALRALALGEEAPLAELGVRAPGKFARMLVPGF
jgi:hypothetical protein